MNGGIFRIVWLAAGLWCAVAAAAEPAVLQPSEMRRIDAGGSVDWVAAGGNGRFLCFALCGEGKVGILDMADPKQVVHVNVESGKFCIAAGAEKLFVLAIDSQQLQRWDLAGRSARRRFRISLYDPTGLEVESPPPDTRVIPRYTPRPGGGARRRE